MSHELCALLSVEQHQKMQEVRLFLEKQMTPAALFLPLANHGERREPDQDTRAEPAA